ncbi:MAG: polysaccharide biosynthesis/export family protein [Bacteroidota bacterium]
MKTRTHNATGALLLMTILFASSCVQQKKMLYTSGTEEQFKEAIPAYISEDSKIEPYDRLYLRVLSLDEQTSRLFNVESRLYGEINLHLNSYSVNENGQIDVPFVGPIEVGGYTLVEAKSKIEKELNLYLPNTSVDLKFAGNYITVLGEVRVPGNHLYFRDRLNVFEAIGHAGGILDYGNKQQIILVRTENGTTTYHTVDLTRSDIAQSAFFYLQPDDVIIIQPLRAKFRTLRSFQLESLVLSGVTTIVTVLYFFSAN